MTLVLLGAGAMLAAVGTRLAVAAFLAAAVVGGVSGGPLVAAAVWAPAMAAGLVGLGAAPRSIAIPSLGMAAALLAASGGNAATVLTAWVVSSAVAVAARRDPRGRGWWEVGLLSSDLLVAAAVVYTALRSGFADWVQGIDAVGGGLLLAAALTRIPLVAEVGGVPVGILVVRTQVVVLASLAVPASSTGALLAGAVVGAAAFGLGGVAGDPARRDGVQEAGLVVLALAAAAVGWRPGGWVWGALAGGTLTHYLRLSVDPLGLANVLVRAIQRAGGIGLPLLPAAAALAAAAAMGRGGAAVGVVVGLAAGLGARAWWEPEPKRGGRRRSPAAGVWSRAAAWAASALAVVAALFGPVLALPSPPGGDAAPWPPVIAGVAVLVAGGAGLLRPQLAPGRPPRGRVPPSWLTVRPLPPPGRAVGVLLALLVGGAAVLWVLGTSRGFL